MTNVVCRQLALAVSFTAVLLVGCHTRVPESAPGPSSASGLAIPRELEDQALLSVESPPSPASDTLLIRNATVMTGTGTVYAPGYVKMRAGRILEVGPGGGDAGGLTQIVDAGGRPVTPGLIDTHSHMGVYPSPGTRAHQDGNEATDPVTAGVWAEHSFWPEDPAIERAVAGGVTTAAILPGSANLVGGRGVILHLRPALGARAMRLSGAPEILKLACGENPKRVYGDNKRAPSTRMANLRALREALFKAQKYQRDWDRYAQKLQARPNGAARPAAKAPGDPPTPPDRDAGLETLARLLSGEVLAQWHCYSADDMLAAIQVSQEFGFRIASFHHALDAYKIRDILAQRSIGVSTWYDWYGFKMESFDGIPESLALVHEAGGTAIVHSDSAIGIQMLHLEAGRALAAGRAAGVTLSEQDALRWVTLNPARALGIDSQVGSLEPGKRADLVLWSHPPTDVRARAERVWIDGIQVWDHCQPDAPWSDFELGYTDTTHAGFAPGQVRPAGCGGKSPSLPELALPVASGRNLTARAPADSRGAGAVGSAAAAAPAAYVGARLQQPGTGLLVPGILLVVEGRLSVLPPDAPIPSGVNRIELSGKVITPGLVAASSQLGMAEVGAESPSQDLELKGEELIPAFQVWDGFNPRSSHLPVARSEGITAAVITPVDGVLSGQSAYVELKPDTALRDASVLQAPVALHLNLSGGEVDGAFGSRAVAWMRLREIFDDAQSYATRKGDYEQARARAFALSRTQLEALQGALRGEVPVVVTAHQASDIRAALEFAQRYALRLILQGGAEAWLEADALANARVPVILDPAENLPEGFDRLRVRSDLAWLLRQKGVPVLLTAPGPYNARQLRFKAGLAWRMGLPEGDARLAMTELPARVFGLKDAGVLAEGQPATFAIWSGDPLMLDTRLEQLYIRGQTVSLRSRQTLLLERYRHLRAPDPGPGSHAQPVQPNQAK